MATADAMLFAVELTMDVVQFAPPLSVL